MSEDDELIKHMTKLIATSLDRIEQLTAERDAAYAQGYSDAETEISKSALGQRNYFLHSQYENATDHIKVLTAERDRLRDALIELVQHTHNCERQLTEDLHHVDFCGESVPLTNAREALKGEAP